MAIIRNASTLTRWAAFAPGSVMPASLDQLQLSDQVALEQADPELFALLSGTAPAELELAALQGSLAAAPATPAERQQQANAERVAELVAAHVGGRPGYYRELPNGEQEYVPPQPGNTTAMFELEALDPIAAQRERMQATVMPKGNGLSAEDAQWVQQEMMRARMESVEIAQQEAIYQHMEG